MSTPGGSPSLRRDRLTLSLYATFITWGWYLYAFSPAVPLIAAEFGITRAQAGLHGTASAVGTLVTGLVSSWVALRFGRRVQSIAGAGFVVVGVAMLVTGPSLAFTLPAVFVTSVGGGLTIAAATPALVAHHGLAGSAVVTEANGMGAAVGLLAPLALGGSVALGWGWRPAVGLALVLAVVAGLLVVPLRDRALGRGSVNRAPTDDDAPASRGWSLTFRLFMAALVCGVAIEFATTYWAADLVLDRTGAPESVASASVSALVAGMTVSRFVVGPLSLRKAPEKLLLVAYAVALVGWAVFWTATTPVMAVAGLVVAGLGYGAHYPLTISLVLRSSDGRPDQAQARSTLGTGLAVGLAPFLLGAVADQVGPHTAFLLLPVLMVAGGTAITLGLASVRRDLRPRAPAPTA